MRISDWSSDVCSSDLLDPPTADVSARCLSMLAQLGYGRDHTVVRRGLDYLRREQEADGSWYGRWGVNYVYGTWSALSAFNACGADMTEIGRASCRERACQYV